MEVKRSHPARGRGGYERVVTKSWHVATIARWWKTWMEVKRSHPPLGRGGYERVVTKSWRVAINRQMVEDLDGG
jgi:hypothetical protein